MNFSNLLTLGLLASLIHCCPMSSMGAEYRNVTDAAKDLAPDLGKVIRDKADTVGKGILQVAVLPFGNAKGKVGEFYLASSTLQGELSSLLRKETQQKFIVWDPFMLKDAVEAYNKNNPDKETVDLKAISIRNQEASQATLEKLKLDAVIVGSFQTEEFTYEALNVNVDIIFADSVFQDVSQDIVVAPENTVKLDNFGSISTRFKVEVFVKSEENPLNLQAVTQKFSEFEYAVGDFYLDLDPSVRGKSFTIRLTNTGDPPVRWRNMNSKIDKERLYCAAVFVDGVNSILEKVVDKQNQIQYFATQRHPREVSKWVLAPPNCVVADGYTTGETAQHNKFKALNVANGDGSTVSVVGFQQDLKKAREFVFADSGDSVAHELGITKEIGMITLYFFAEKLSGDKGHYPQKLAPTAGVSAGKEILNPVRTVNVKTYEDPVEIWRIHYRYKNEPNSFANVKKNLESNWQHVIPITDAIEKTKKFQGTH